MATAAKPRKPTPAQREALELIATGQVARLYSTARQIYPISHGIKTATMDALFRAGLVRYDEDGGPAGQWQARGTYRLTDAGSAVFAPESAASAEVDAAVTRTVSDGEITAKCGVCKDSVTAPDKGMGRAVVAAWETQHQHRG